MLSDRATNTPVSRGGRVAGNADLRYRRPHHYILGGGLANGFGPRRLGGCDLGHLALTRQRHPDAHSGSHGHPLQHGVVGGVDALGASVTGRGSMCPTRGRCGVFAQLYIYTGCVGPPASVSPAGKGVSDSNTRRRGHASRHLVCGSRCRNAWSQQEHAPPQRNPTLSWPIVELRSGRSIDNRVGEAGQPTWPSVRWIKPKSTSIASRSAPRRSAPNRPVPLGNTRQPPVHSLVRREPPP